MLECYSTYNVFTTSLHFHKISQNLPGSIYYLGVVEVNFEKENPKNSGGTFISIKQNFVYV